MRNENNEGHIGESRIKDCLSYNRPLFSGKREYARIISAVRDRCLLCRTLRWSGDKD
jgi:hypothetical protein